MTFVKGQSGNPKGRPSIARSFSEALRRELDKERDGKTTRDKIAAVVAEKAVAGDMAAVQWIVDRTEGKTPERLEANLSGEFNHSVPDATVAAVLERFGARGGLHGGEA